MFDLSASKVTYFELPSIHALRLSSNIYGDTYIPGAILGYRVYEYEDTRIILAVARFDICG